MYKVYTSINPYRDTHIVPQEECWDNQKLVFEASTLSGIEKRFKKRVASWWRKNKRYYVSEEEVYEIHCDRNFVYETFRPKIDDSGDIIYYSPLSYEISKRSRGGLMVIMDRRRKMARYNERWNRGEEEEEEWNSYY